MTDLFIRGGLLGLLDPLTKLKVFFEVFRADTGRLGEGTKPIFATFTPALVVVIGFLEANLELLGEDSANLFTLAERATLGVGSAFFFLSEFKNFETGLFLTTFYFLVVVNGLSSLEGESILRVTYSTFTYLLTLFSISIFAGSFTSSCSITVSGTLIGIDMMGLLASSGGWHLPTMKMGLKEPSSS